MAQKNLHLEDKADQAIEVINLAGSTLGMPASDVEAQISAAQRYRRDEDVEIDRAIREATVDESVAAQCFYSVPLDGKKVEGLSVRAAEILFRNWRNLRVLTEGSHITDTSVVARGIAWDLETNVAVSATTSRSIISRNKVRFAESMIQTTMRAAISIAFRNVVIRIIPIHHRERFVAEVKAKLLPPAAQLSTKVDEMLRYLKQTYGVTHVQVCAALGRKSAEEITGEDVVLVRGLVSAIRDGDTTVEEAFGMQPRRGGTPEEKAQAAAQRLAQSVKSVKQSASCAEQAGFTASDIDAALRD